jgi:4-hydroxy-tetrahydrodipicolinate synthase/2-dehydro-3-deoxy-D-gluconate aldolase
VKGIITPMVTPISGGRIDENGISELMAFLKRIGVNAAFPMGSTGLFTLFSTEEHIRAIELTVKHASGLKVLAGSGRNDIDETLRVARSAVDSGADAVVIVTPFYIRMSQESISNYYSRIASSLDSDIIAYNIPQFTGNQISADTLSSLMREHSNIIGVKDSSGDLRSTQMYISELPSGSFIYQGQDDLLLPSIALGVSGGVCGTTNFSDLAVRIWNSAGKEESRQIQLRLSSMMRALALSDFPKAYYYLFERLVMKNENPRSYMPAPINDLSDQEERSLNSWVSIK